MVYKSGDSSLKNRKPRSSQNDLEQLRILQWNAGGLSQSKKTELATVLQRLDVDVFTIMEANLKTDDLQYYQLHGYSLYLMSKHRQVASGILVGVRSHIISDFTEIKEMGNTQDKSEIIKLDVWKNTHRYRIYAVYNPPNNKPDFSFLDFTGKTILLGDFNAHSNLWGYQDTNSAGKVMEDILNSSPLELVFNVGDTHTYLHYNGTQTTPDLLLVSSNIFPGTKRIILDDPGSGHRPVIATIQLPTRYHNFKVHPRKSWNFQKGNWDKYTKYLENNLNHASIDYSQHPSTIGKYITAKILRAAKLFIPRGAVRKYKCFWSKDLEMLKNQRETLRRTAELSKETDDILQWRHAAAKLKKAILNAKRDTFGKFLATANFSEDSAKTYKFLDKVQNKKTPPQKNPMTYRNTLLNTDTDIAHAFSKVYSLTQRKGPYARKKSRDIKTEIKSLKTHLTHQSGQEDEIFVLPFTEQELLTAIQDVKNKKSPGDDGIHPEFLKHLGKEALLSILIWFNKIWETGTCPSQWKKAIIIPILKKGKDPSQIRNYRPISLTSILGKVMEKMINKRLNWYFERYGIIGNEQAGFRIKRSTSQQVAKLSQNIKDALDNKHTLTAVFVDLRSAYDSVWKELLILKLLKAGVKSNMLAWFESFLAERAIKVKYGNSTSHYKLIQTGVPQGAVTSCTLFNLYINDLISELHTIPGIHCLLYADDLVFWTETSKYKTSTKTEKSLNAALKKLELWCSNNNMDVNLLKTRYQSFSLSHHSISPSLQYKAAPIPKTNEFTYLGVKFDNKLTWKPHIENITSQASKRLSILKRLTGTKWGCNIQTLTTTYKMYIIPSLLYCCEPLLTASENSLNKLETLQNQALRLITGAVKTTPIDAMYLRTGLQPIRQQITERTILLYEKLIRMEDNYWLTYNNIPRNLKTQQGFIQVARNLKTQYSINNEPQTLQHQTNPMHMATINYTLNLVQPIIKNQTNTSVLQQLALETIHTRYPEENWLHIYTDGSKMTDYANVGAGIHCKLFSFYIPVGQHMSAYDGEIEAIRVALTQLALHTEKFTNAVILSDSKAAIQSIANSALPTSEETFNCQQILDQLASQDKTLMLQWIPSHCEITGNDKADQLAKRGASLPIIITKPLSYQSQKTIVKHTLKSITQKELEERTQHKHWKTEVINIPNGPRRAYVAQFRLSTGHDCLGKHLHRFGIMPTSACMLCNSNDDMDRQHLQSCPALFSPTEEMRYWEARFKMMSLMGQ